MLHQWKSILGYKTDQAISGTVCIDHFNPDDIITTISLVKSAVPTISKHNCLDNSNGSNISSGTNNIIQIEGVDANLPACCQEATVDVRNQFSALKKDFSDLKEQHQTKLQSMMQQIIKYQNSIRALQEQSTPPYARKANQMEEMRKKIKRLQDSVNYRNRRLTVMNLNRNINDKQQAEDKGITRVAEVNLISQKLRCIHY